MYKVNNAIILAAGFGFRCAPLTYTTSKGLLTIRGEVMIERAIKQLHEKKITDITVVVGYKKEQFDYLADKYHVTLVYNPDYAVKNNLSSLCCVLDKLHSTYLVVADNYVMNNCYNEHEAASWTACSYIAGSTHEWCLTLADNRVTAITIGGRDCHIMVGPSYFSPALCDVIKPLFQAYNEQGYTDFYWEDVLKLHLDTLVIYANDQTGNVIDLDDLDTMRAFDPNCRADYDNPVMQTISAALQVGIRDITHITPIKQGMTNDSFSFITNGKDKYIYRIPGKGTEKIINRHQERAVYQAIAPLNIGDNTIYLNPENGHKIATFITNASICDPYNPQDIARCMQHLRNFHEQRVQVGHAFDLFERITFYEKIWAEHAPCFDDYHALREKIFSLKPYIDQTDKDYCLAHIDANPENFLLQNDGVVFLIDWEYSGMQDPHVDIAFFISYIPYSREQVDALIDVYFNNACSTATRIKIYAYIAIVGFLWFNWCEYARHEKNITHGEYALRQYNYAKTYCQYVEKELMECKPKKKDTD